MRRIYLILALLAGCGPGAGSTASSFAVDSCTPQPATIEAIQLWHDGAELSPSARAPTASGGQGLPMADIDVYVWGTFGTCVPVDAKLGRLHESGGLKVTSGQRVHLVMGPVDADFDVDVTVGTAQAHATIRNYHVVTVN